MFYRDPFSTLVFDRNPSRTFVVLPGPPSHTLVFSNTPRSHLVFYWDPFQTLSVLPRPLFHSWFITGTPFLHLVYYRDPSPTPDFLAGPLSHTWFLQRSFSQTWCFIGIPLPHLVFYRDFSLTLGFLPTLLSHTWCFTGGFFSHYKNASQTICLTEALLAESIGDAALFRSNKVIHRNDRPSDKGLTSPTSQLNFFSELCSVKRPSTI